MKKLKSVLQTHEFSGCGNVCRFTGIEKSKTLVAMENKRLTHLGNLNVTREYIMSEAAKFVGLCYNIRKEKDMSKKSKVYFNFKCFQIHFDQFYAKSD